MPPKRTREDDIEAVEDHPLVVFRSEAQRTRFIQLSSKPIIPTRFLSNVLLRRLGIEEQICEILNYIGFKDALEWGSETFPSLTLEFLSSFVFRRETHDVYFRLFNTSYKKKVSEFGALFGVEADEDDVNSPPDDFNIHNTWSSITGLTDVNISSLHVNDVQHPTLRFFLRMLVSTVFGRKDQSKLNKTDVTLLGSFLNVDSTEEFKLNASLLLVSWFNKVAKGSMVQIVVGGMITHLAKILCDFDPDTNTLGYERLTVGVPRADAQFFSHSTHWLEELEGHVYKYQVKPGYHMLLPCRNLPPVVHLHWDSRCYTRSSYLIPDNLLVQGGLGAPVPRMGAPSRTSGPRRHQPVHIEATQQPTPATFSHPCYGDPAYEMARRTHRDINSDLAIYQTGMMFQRMGLYQPDQPMPSFWRGADQYPGAIFEEHNVDRSTWGPDYGHTYGGFSGQWYGETGAGGTGAGGSGVGGSGVGGSRFDAFAGGSGAGPSGAGDYFDDDEDLT